MKENKIFETKVINNCIEQLNQCKKNVTNNPSITYIIDNLIDILSNKLDTQPFLVLEIASSLLSKIQLSPMQRGLILSKILQYNTKVIESKPYSILDYPIYYNANMHMSFSKLKKEVDEIATNLKSNLSKPLTNDQKSLYKLIINSEQNRLNVISFYKIIKQSYKNLNDYTINIIIGDALINKLTEYDCECLRIYLNTIKENKNYPLKMAEEQRFNTLLIALFDQDFQTYSNNLVSLKAKFYDLLIDYIESYEIEEKEQLDKDKLWQSIIKINFDFLDTKPYSCSLLYENEPNYTFKQIRKALKTIASRNTESEKKLKDVIIKEEQYRLLNQQTFKEIKNLYYNLTIENIDKIIDLLKTKITTNEKALKEIKTMLINQMLTEQKIKENREVKKEKNENPLDLTGLNLELKPLKLGYSLSQLKEYRLSLEHLKTKVLNNEPISIAQYQQALFYLQILDENEISKLEKEYYLRKLFNSLIINPEAYEFLYHKGKYLVLVNLDVYPILEEIDIYNELIKEGNQEEQQEALVLLKEKYHQLFNTICDNYAYEFSLIREKK